MYLTSRAFVGKIRTNQLSSLLWRPYIYCLTYKNATVHKKVFFYASFGSKSYETIFICELNHLLQQFPDLARHFSLDIS